MPTTPASGRARGRSSSGSKRKLPRCHNCGRPIRIPKGWSRGPAVRRHYWRQHPEIMRGDSRSSKGGSR